MKPLEPVDTTHLFAPLHEELIRLLRSLEAEDWQRPTVAGAWRVRDIVAHLLDGDLRALSAVRDRHFVPAAEPIDDYNDLVRYLNRLNAEWVAATQRLSPRVLTDLLATTGAEVAATYAALDAFATSPISVAWAGESESKNWMHVGRDYTERWHHQAQIRDAIGAEGLYGQRWFYPLLDLSMRALPHAYREIEVEPGASIVVEVDAPGGGLWTLTRDESSWRIFSGGAETPTARIRVDADTAWKSLYHALTPDEARTRARVDGDEELAAPFFGARSVMV